MKKQPPVQDSQTQNFFFRHQGQKKKNILQLPNAWDTTIKESEPGLYRSHLTGKQELRNSTYDANLWAGMAPKLEEPVGSQAMLWYPRGIPWGSILQSLPLKHDMLSTTTGCLL